MNLAYEIIALSYRHNRVAAEVNKRKDEKHLFERINYYLTLRQTQTVSVRLSGEIASEIFNKICKKYENANCRFGKGGEIAYITIERK